MSQATDAILRESNDRFGLLGTISVEQYHEMIRTGILGSEDPFELLQGVLVRKMPKDPIHEVVIRVLSRLFHRIAPSGCIVGVNGPLTTDDSEPEPDLWIARGDDAMFLSRHPSPAETVLVVEVANTSLRRDRGLKLEIYSAAGCPNYWIVNTIDQSIEAYSTPRMKPDIGYTNRVIYTVGQRAPVSFDGQTIADILVDDLFPARP